MNKTLRFYYFTTTVGEKLHIWPSIFPDGALPVLWNYCGACVMIPVEVIANFLSWSEDMKIGRPDTILQDDIYWSDCTPVPPEIVKLMI
jgi:hypothetical protein